MVILLLFLLLCFESLQADMAQAQKSSSWADSIVSILKGQAVWPNHLTNDELFGNSSGFVDRNLRMVIREVRLYEAETGAWWNMQVQVELPDSSLHWIDLSIDSKKTFKKDFGYKFSKLSPQNRIERDIAWVDSVTLNLKGKQVWANYLSNLEVFEDSGGNFNRTAKLVIREIEFEDMDIGDYYAKLLIELPHGSQRWIDLNIDSKDPFESFREKFAYKFTKLSPQKRMEIWTKKFGKVNAENIMKRSVRIGMPKQAVLESWGKPDDINRTVTAAGSREQWIYGDVYLYIDNDVLTAFQD